VCGIERESDDQKVDRKNSFSSFQPKMLEANI
jgi:hypothetical protein